MKRFLLLSVALFALWSCKKNNLEFSCDPKVNEFVVKNQEEFAKIAINELVSYDPKVQRAIFNSWDYQRKRTAWLDKLQYVLSHTQLNNVEKDHIKELINHINQNYFKKENITADTVLQANFAAKWISYSSTKLKWDNQFIAFLVYRLYTDQAQFDSELSKRFGSTTSLNSEQGNCDCSVSSDYCGGVSCESGECVSSTGCGWLWSMSCNGNCY